jgi:hypothetical protein
MRYQFVVAVWGEQYVSYFLQICLPSLLTTGNLLGYSRDDAELDIYTTYEDAPAFHDSPAIKALAACMNIRISKATVARDDIIHDARHELMTTLHKRALDRSDELDSAIFFISPDTVVADGTLMHLRQLLLSGKRMIMVGAMRVSQSGFIADFYPRFNPGGRYFTAIGSRELVDFIIAHPHEDHRGFVWSDDLADAPSHIYFPVGDEGFVQRGFHLHPMAMYPAVRGNRPPVTIDDPWLDTAVPNLDDWHVVHDSDDAYILDFGTPPNAYVSRYRLDPYLHAAAWAKEKTNERQRWVVSNPVFVHRSPLGAAWEVARNESDAVIKMIVDRIPVAPRWIPPWEFPVATSDER